MLENSAGGEEESECDACFAGCTMCGTIKNALLVDDFLKNDFSPLHSSLAILSLI